MGWSATAAACNVMDALEAYCRHATETSNSWEYKGNQYFAELSSREYRDGHISMQIYKVKADGRCYRSGSIYIEPDGKIRTMPKYLREAIKSYLPQRGHPFTVYWTEHLGV